MKEITVIFPHLLFAQYPSIEAGRTVYLMAESRLFKQYNFHQQKTILKRAPMKAYATYLLKNEITVKYVDAVSKMNHVRKLPAQLFIQNITTLNIADVADNWLRRRIIKRREKHTIKIVAYATPIFVNTPNEVKD